MPKHSKQPGANVGELTGMDRLPVYQHTLADTLVAVSARSLQLELNWGLDGAE